MPRSRHRGRKARRNARTRQRSRSSIKQITNVPPKESNRQKNAPVSNSPSSSDHKEQVSKLGGATGVNSSASNGYSDQNWATTNLNGMKLSTDTRRTEQQPEVSVSATRACFRYYKSCKCVANSSEDKINVSGMPNSVSRQEIQSGISGVLNSVQNQDFAKFSLVKKKKTPYGKVKIYSTGELDATEDERIMREAVKLLKYVKNCTNQDKQCKKPNSATDSFVVRVRKFFGK